MSNLLCADELAKAIKQAGLMDSRVIRVSVLDVPPRIPAHTKHIFCQGALPSMTSLMGTGSQNKKDNEP